LERLPRSLAGELTARDPLELLIEQRGETIQRFAATGFGKTEQERGAGLC
jgi:hypothetical protein